MLYLITGNMKRNKTAAHLAEALAKNKVMIIDEIKEELGGVSTATAFRRLRCIRYRRSYNHNGRFYSIDEPEKYDEIGLWSYKGIRFSQDSDLTATVYRLIHESEEGRTQRELRDILGVRVQNTLQVLLRRRKVKRSQVRGVYVYLSSRPKVKQEQLRSRETKIANAEKQQEQLSTVVAEVVIEILLILVRQPGMTEAEIMTRLQGRSPPVSIEQVRWVFERYQLGQKKGH